MYALSCIARPFSFPSLTRTDTSSTRFVFLFSFLARELLFFSSLRELLFFFSFSMIAWKPCLTWIDLSTLSSCTGLCFLCTYAHQRNNLAPQFLSFS